jgi:glucose/arabinose dehydrogenase
MHRTTVERSAAALAVIVALQWSVALQVAADVPTDLELQTVATNLSNPILVTGADDGSGRLFVVEQTGEIEILGVGTFLDITTRVDSRANEEGLLGLAFHPDYANNGFFYVNYTYDVPASDQDTTRVSRFQVSAADPNMGDPASEVILLEFVQDADNHNGGDLHFGPDGYLYVATGDGGGSNDLNERAQHLDNLLGKILRIDVDGGGTYEVPADNPFVASGGGLGEIWSYGLRNPWRFSFDRANGDLYIGDVGQGAREEVDRQPAASTGGENYGWSCEEGDTKPNYNECDGEPLTAPILVYNHTLGCAVTGGYLYRGVIGGLHGLYVFGDYCSGRIWFASESAGGWSSEEWSSVGFGLSSFGEDDDGELYVCDRDNGTVSRFHSPSAIFTDLFEFGDFVGWTVAVGK